MVETESAFTDSVLWYLEKIFLCEEKAAEEESLPTATVPSSHNVDKRSIVEPLMNVESSFRELPCIETFSYPSRLSVSCGCKRKLV